MLTRFPGDMPPAPRWGQENVAVSPELRYRIKKDRNAEGEVAVVLGAGGSLAPDFINALILKGTRAVVGVDISLTYRCKDAIYRKVDLLDKKAVKRFYSGLRAWAEENNLKLGITYDLSTVQTSPGKEKHISRDALEDSKDFLVEAICDTEGDARLFYMSSAEIYGAPDGAPYKEDHIKEPFNPYGKAKFLEEQKILSHNGKKTRSGRLYVTALRTWTIAMVTYDKDGNMVCSRNYNDPMMMMCDKFVRAGIRHPVIDERFMCQFHIAEEVSEVSLLLASEPLDSDVWGRAYNCIGKPATHGRLRDITFDIFSRKVKQNPLLTFPANIIFGNGKLPKEVFSGFAYFFQNFGGLLGARDVGGRLPFLFKDTHMDSTSLANILKDKLTVPAGSSSEEAARRLSEAILRGGPKALITRRYRNY